MQKSRFFHNTAHVYIAMLRSKYLLANKGFARHQFKDIADMHSEYDHFAIVTFSCVIISIFKEDNVFSITASLPYSPPVNTDIDYYRTPFGLGHFLQVLRC